MRINSWVAGIVRLGLFAITLLSGSALNFGSSGLSVLACKEKEYLMPGLRRPRDAEQGRRKRRQEKEI